MLNKIRKIYPFIYGVFGSLGFLCCINILLDLDYKVSAHPYAHPFCVVAGCLDIVSFIDEERKILRILKDLLITAVSFFICIFAWNGLWRFVSDFIKGW